MKPAKERIPYADRPEVIREFCTCMWVHTQNPSEPEGPALSRLHIRNPDCKLHGDHVKEAPY